MTNVLLTFGTFSEIRMSPLGDKLLGQISDGNLLGFDGSSEIQTVEVM